MKKINYSNIAPGIAQPFLKDTWDYLQTGLQDSLTALAKGLIGDDFASGVNILWGCKVISATQVSSGWVYYQGELYACTGWNGVVTDTLVGVLVTGYSGNDPVKFSDGSMHNVHENKYLVLHDAVSGSGIADLSDFAYGLTDTWHVVDDAGEPQFSLHHSQNATYRKLSFKKHGFTNVHLNGAWDVSAFGGGNYNSVFTLPVGYRPLKPQRYVIYAENAAITSDTPALAELYIDSTGVVSIRVNYPNVNFPAPAATTTFDVGNIIFPLD